MAENKGVKAWLVKNIGVSWKTTLIGYITAIVLAVQPLLDAEVDFSDKYQRIKYIWKIGLAVAVAFMGKYSADSHQVKQVDQKVEEMKNE